MTFFFFFNDTATTEIYTLSLHDALPILQGFADRFEERLAVLFHQRLEESQAKDLALAFVNARGEILVDVDRKSTRLNSSHLVISYAVFCLKKKKTSEQTVESAKRTQTNG